MEPDVDDRGDEAGDGPEAIVTQQCRHVASPLRSNVGSLRRGCFLMERGTNLPSEPGNRRDAAT